MKKEVQVFDYSEAINKAVTTGVLLTTRSGDEVNTMTIGWGHLGTEWNRPIFVAYVRESRHTRKLLEENPEFTINVPLNGVDPEIIRFCGRNSGRDVDKFRHLGLTKVESDHVSVPGIKELPLTLECRVIYTMLQEPDTLPRDIQDRFYPKDDQGKQNRHYVFYGQVVGAYLIED